MNMLRSGLGIGCLGLIVLLANGGFAFGQEREAGSGAPDARKVLDEALAKAATGEKLVFLHFGGPGCGWCVRLKALLAREDVSEVLARDYVVVEIDLDRMEGAEDVFKRYSPPEFPGIPWYLILDPRGKALITSDGPKGNFGYPTEPGGIDHFLSMIEKTARRIEPAQRKRLRSALEDEASKIVREMKDRYENEGSPAKVDPSAPELKQLEGTWTAVSWVFQGKDSGPNGRIRLEVKGVTFTWYFDEHAMETKAYNFDPTRDPRVIDRTRSRTEQFVQ